MSLDETNLTGHSDFEDLAGCAAHTFSFADEGQRELSHPKSDSTWPPICHCGLKTSTRRSPNSPPTTPRHFYNAEQGQFLSVRILECLEEDTAKMQCLCVQLVPESQVLDAVQAIDLMHVSTTPLR